MYYKDTMWDSQKLRETFLKFFREKGHIIVPSSSLVPQRDPTLLFTSAGMVQFKPLWSGEIPLPYKRAASVQKCLRLSDIEKVGETIRHDTFFEMLGNFSFGDYFKEEAIKWAWELLTDVLHIPEEHLFVSCHPEDDETYKIWSKKIGLHPKKIFRLKDNFWGPAGGSGPCGPDTEIYFDMGKTFGNCTLEDEECDRFVEVWNIVFPQYNQQGKQRLELKNKGVDTGMGLERLAMIMQKKESIFETDLFYPIILQIERLTEKDYKKYKRELRIIADHIRALTFSISDSVYPSNEGRGYVLRRLIRRSLVQLHKMGVDKPLLYNLVPTVTRIMGEYYPELRENLNHITLIIKSEEERFLKTLDRGISILNDLIEDCKNHNKKYLSGKDVFLLYDTYGFPPELTENLLKEAKLSIDNVGFEEAMKKQKERAKKKARFRTKEIAKWEILSRKKPRFTGYKKLQEETDVKAFRFIDDGIELVLEKTPFYAESGGQVGDTGVIKGDGFEIRVLDTQKQELGHIHYGKVKGVFKPGHVLAIVDRMRRLNIMRNHTATHILHTTLRKTLGKHVQQKGSLVTSDRLRFDFSHPSPLNEDEIRVIEDIVNQTIAEEREVITYNMPFEEAKKSGALAFFGEKYGDLVRIVEIKDFSKEFCAGTHVKNTSQILTFKIISEKGIAAGIRRIEAVTGETGYKLFQNYAGKISLLSSILKTDEERLIERLQELIKQEKMLQHELKKINKEREKILIKDLLNQRKTIEDIEYIISDIDGSKEFIRDIADGLRKIMKNGIGLLAQLSKNSIFVVSFVGESLTDKVLAGEILKAISGYIKGGGGGRPHLAEGGGKNPEGWRDVKRDFKKILSKIVDLQG